MGTASRSFGTAPARQGSAAEVPDDTRARKASAEVGLPELPSVDSGAASFPLRPPIFVRVTPSRDTDSVDGPRSSVKELPSRPLRATARSRQACAGAKARRTSS